MGYTTCGPVSRGEAAVQFAETYLPDVVLMDIRLHGPLSGAGAARLIWQKLQIPVVYVTAHADAATIEEVIGRPASLAGCR
jgi:DNA-binding NarL/FixJ family response regulator